MNNIEEKFFKTFGIRKVRKEGIANGEYPIAVGYEVYPEITDRILLELICISDLKNEILQYMIDEQEYRKDDEDYSDALLKQVQSLFECEVE